MVFERSVKMDIKELTDSELFALKDKLEHDLARLVRTKWSIFNTSLNDGLGREIVEKLEFVEEELTKRDEMVGLK
jgi:hypothetical protein